MKPRKTRIALGVSVLALSGLAASLTPEPVYNPSAEVRMSAVITAVRQVPQGSPLAGTHLTVQTKTATADVYLGPTNFIKFFKTEFPVGAAIQIVGARADAGDVILAREVTEGATSIMLRDFTGAPVWQHWGVAAAAS
jgi:hypothetical protein